MGNNDTAANTAAASTRRWDLDALRGLMLVLMTLTHLPTRWSDTAGQPFGYVSAAEGFVLLSAYMAGSVYNAKAERQGEEAMKTAFFQRALKLYACQLGLLAFAFTVVAGIGLLASEVAVTDMLDFFMRHPGRAMLNAGLLIYSPALLDILPIYIVFMLASPLLMLHGRHSGWGAVLGLSVLLWLGAQFGLGEALHDLATDRFGLRVPYQDTGAFEIFAWQFPWVLGLWMGAAQGGGREGAAPIAFPRWMVDAALVVAVSSLLWRHGVGQTPLPGHDNVNLLFDKWQLGPLRLVNFLALLLLAVHFGPALKRKLPRLPVLETLGRASLPVFCAHLVLALLALALFGAAHPERPWTVDALILVSSFYALWLVARAVAASDRRAAARRARREGPRKADETLSFSGATR